jgi:hypothetical protein
MSKDMKALASAIKMILYAGVLMSLGFASLGISIGIGLRAAKWVLTL